MNVFDTPRNFVPVLAALVLALALTALPHTDAAAEEVSTVKIMIEEAAPQDPVLLRHLLSNPARSAQQQDLLDRAMDGVYEELADATQPQNQGFIQSVNDLLGVKTGSKKARARG